MSVSDIQPPDSYSQEDVQHILQIAIARRADPGELTRAQLWEIATELEIDRESLELAERDWLNRKQLDLKREEFDRYRRDRLRHKAVRFAIVSGFAIVLDLIGGGAITWSLYAIALLGLPLALEAWKTFQTRGETYEQSFQRWKLKNEMKESFSSLWERLKRAWQV